MLFHSFSSQEERRACGGSCFIEFQHCTLQPKTSIKRIVSVRSIKHWQIGSLYLLGDDMDDFLSLYTDIFNCGIYNNTKSGLVDLFGINYYTPESEENVIEKLLERNSEDDRILIKWMKSADKHNGFYILGV